MCSRIAIRIIRIYYYFAYLLFTLPIKDVFLKEGNFNVSYTDIGKIIICETIFKKRINKINYAIILRPPIIFKIIQCFIN